MKDNIDVYEEIVKYLKTKILAFGDKYYAHGNRAQILEDAGLSPKQIALTLKGLTNA